jgi:release factor glutamine methyltransferase
MKFNHKIMVGLGLIGMSTGLVNSVLTLDDATLLKKEEKEVTELLYSFHEIVSEKAYSKIDDVYSNAIKSKHSEGIAYAALGVASFFLMGYAMHADFLKPSKRYERIQGDNIESKLYRELNKKKLNAAQKKQLYSQIMNHQHETYRTDIDLGNLVLQNFWVYKNVMRPEKMTSKDFAEYITNNNEGYLGKKVLDLGTGTGILGITAALNGAKSVLCTDISDDAINNTKANIRKIKNIKVVKSNLFENVRGKYDLILFNYPFFHEEYIKDFPVSQSMLEGKTLVKDFFEQAKNYLTKDGTILVPFFDLAGKATHPEIAQKYGYEVNVVKQLGKTKGLQNGSRAIYEIKRN